MYLVSVDPMDRSKILKNQKKTKNIWQKPKKFKNWQNKEKNMFVITAVIMVNGSL